MTEDCIVLKSVIFITGFVQIVSERCLTQTIVETGNGVSALVDPIKLCIEMSGITVECHRLTKEKG